MVGYSYHCGRDEIETLIFGCVSGVPCIQVVWSVNHRSVTLLVNGLWNSNLPVLVLPKLPAANRCF